MRFFPLTVLHDRDALSAGARPGAAGMAQLVLFVALGCAVYGAVLSSWCPDRLFPEAGDLASWSQVPASAEGEAVSAQPLKLALFGAAKLPILFLGTTAFVAVLDWTVAMLFGAALRARDVLSLVFSAMSVAVWIMLALAPVALLFSLSGAPVSGSAETLRRAHNCLLVTHVCILGGAGLAGCLSLWRSLRALVPDAGRAASIGLAWLAAFAFVGCQAAWILRPFVGSPFYEIAFLREDAFSRNFYEFVFGEVLPFLLFD